MGNDVLRVAMAAVAVNVITDFIEHGGGGQPLAVGGGQAMKRFQRIEQQHGGFAHFHGVIGIDVVASDGSLKRIPPFGLDLLAGPEASAMFGSHLCEQTVAEAKRGVAKTTKLALLEKLSIDGSTGNNDLGAARADATHAAALLERGFGETLRDALHLGASHAGGLILRESLAHGRQGGSGSRGSNDSVNAGLHDARSDAIEFADNEAAEAFELALAGRVVLEEFVGEANRAEGKANRLTDVTASGNRELTASTAEVDHQGG